jgi:beta-lactamase superfamily II metal-dependent hydrolase
MIEIDVLPASSESKGADSILLRFAATAPTWNAATQRVVLIDGGHGNNASTIESHLETYYHTDHIDCVICTHPDADHINGLVELLGNNEIRVGNLCVHDPWVHAYTISKKIRDTRSTTTSVKSRLDDSLGALDDLLDLAARRKIPVHHPFAGTTIYGAITVLGPTEQYYTSLVKEFPGMHEERKSSGNEEWVEAKYDPTNGHFYEPAVTSSKNDSSTVMLLDHAGFKVLFTGDAGIPGINAAINYAITNKINLSGIDYLQIPHHGSIKNINAKIIETLSPKSAFVSAPWNSEKHPSRLIMNYFKLHKAIDVYHIDTGAIRLSSNAPAREGWNPVSPLSLFETVFVPL